MHFIKLNKFIGIFIIIIFSTSTFANENLNVPVILGTYTLVHSENFEPYMEAVGVGIFMRKLAAHATPVTTITKNNDEWNFKTSTTFTSSEIKFQLGVPFRETTADGRSCLSVITNVDDHRMNHLQRECDSGPNELLITREFTDNQLKMVLVAPTEKGEIISKRVYKKLQRK